MKASWKNRLALVAVAAVVVVALVAVMRMQPARADKDAASAPSHYTVVATEGHNLIVTDNQSNVVYFYTIDKEAKIGSELKLRGSVDLTQVGKPVITPKTEKVGD